MAVATFLTAGSSSITRTRPPVEDRGSGARRKMDGEAGALAERRGRGDVPAVALDDGVDRGEAEPVAARLGGEVGVEDPVQVLRRDAVPLVLHGEPDVAPG